MSRIEEYFKDIEMKVKTCYSIAEAAREKGLDPLSKVEVPLATSLAEKSIGLISSIHPQLNDKKIIDRILELEKEYGQRDIAVAFGIAEEIAKEKFCKFESLLQAIDAGVRLGFAYITLGVVSSPIEGFTELKLKKTKHGEDYFVAYFSGPIRSAGTTASCIVLMLIDYLRETFGYAKYDPDEKEVKRYVTENYDYHERVTNLQYLPTEEEIIFLAKNLPIQIDGEPTEDKEVSNYKDLPRVETNFIRGGMCLIFSEGLAQKAQKGLRMLRGLQAKGFKATGWEFLEDYIALHNKREKGAEDVGSVYMKDLVAGRPVFSHPSCSGGFRFRYGRSRVSGFSAASIHPATMRISDSFLSSGTQLKIEKPTKGCAITSCDSIDGPIVKLKNGSVKKISTPEEAKRIYNNVEEIIYLGDILFSVGDVINRNYELLNPGYVEEWWALELRKAGGNADAWNINFEQAIEISEKYNVPLNPKYIFYWSQISYEEFLSLLDWLNHADTVGKLILPFNKTDKERFSKGKRALELLGVEHDVSIENVILYEEISKALLANLGISLKVLENNFMSKEIDNISEKIKESRGVLEAINKISKYKIKDKAGTFIGARMGRPEKAKLRKLTGSPNVLFPVGEEGGRLRSVNEALDFGSIKADFPIYFCKNCQKETIYFKCERCNNECERMNYCPECGQKFMQEKCPEHVKGQSFMQKRIDSRQYFDFAVKKLDLLPSEIPHLIKGVRGTSSKEHDIENLAKGILRAKYKLCVNKDGTIRYDATELPLTHFKPKEIMTGVEKLREMGYEKDIYGIKLENDGQILELKPHDVILPACPEADEKADDLLFNISRFIDDLLLKFYGLKQFYNLDDKEGLIGHLVVCMAPHNCAGVIGRIIGFSKTQGLIASPYMHAAMRRDCFDYNTFFPIKHNNAWRIRKIGEIVEELKPNKVVDNFNTKEIGVLGFETIGFDDKLKEVKINNFTKHSKLPMFKIKTLLGKKLEVTENHKFLIDGKEKRASELNLGDKIMLPLKADIHSKDILELNLLGLLENENLMVRRIREIIKKVDIDERKEILRKLSISSKQFQNFNLRDSYPANFVLSLGEKIKKEIFKKGLIASKRDNVNTPIIIKLTKELLEVIGLYAAEGYSRSISGKKGLNQVYIASSEKEIRDFIAKIIKNSFGLKPSEKKQDRVTFSSRVLYLFFTKILEAGCDARSKRVPYLFLDLKLEKLASFLRGYFEGDGCAEKNRKKVSCDSISECLLADLEFCLSRFGIFVKRYEYEKEPGPKVREFYVRKNRKIPKFKITKLIIGSDFVNNFYQIGFLSKRKNDILSSYKKIKEYDMRITYDKNFVYDVISSIEFAGEKESYCLNVNNENHLVLGNSVLTKQCDGDEAAVMLLLDVLLNFSKKFLPSHRGGSQDAPLVLNARIRAGEVDEQILDFELEKYPLELYEMAEQGKHSSELKIETVRTRLKKGEEPLINITFTHDTEDFNSGVVNSSYKLLPTMQEKVAREMELVEKIRAVNTSDVARLIIERHLIRDIRGNLRKFSQQEFRCSKCNEKYRRPPLSGICLKCNGNIIFTIFLGSIVKYLEPALQLAQKYNVPDYIKQNLELTKSYIESIFGKEKEKQEALGKWFG